MTKVTAPPMLTAALISRVTPRKGQMPRKRLSRKLLTSAAPTKSMISSPTGPSPLGCHVPAHDRNGLTVLGGGAFTPAEQVQTGQDQRHGHEGAGRQLEIGRAHV